MPILSIPDTSSSPLLETPVEDGKWGCKADGSELASKSRRDDGTNKTKHFYRHSSSITNSSFSSSTHKHALKSYTLMVIISKERIYHLYTVRSFNVCNTKFHGRVALFVGIMSLLRRTQYDLKSKLKLKNEKCNK